MRHLRYWARWLTLVGGILLMSGLGGVSRTAWAAPAMPVTWGKSMDQAFNSYIYVNDGRNNIPSGWANLPQNTPSGWPIPASEVDANRWQKKAYIVDPAGPTQTVRSGQSFTLQTPYPLKDACTDGGAEENDSNPRTHGYWRNMMVITDSSGYSEATWPGGAVRTSYNTGLNPASQYCTPGADYQGSWSFQLTAPTVNTATTYKAKFFAEEASYTSNAQTTVDGDISEVTVPITVEPAAPPTITLTANPTSLPAGQSTTLTATASENVGSTGDDINIVDATTGRVIDSCGNGRTCTTMFSKSYATSRTFKADIGPYGAIPAGGQTVAISNSQIVTWTSSPPPNHNPTVSLSANPTSLPVGQTTTITATAQNLPNGDSVAIIGSDGLTHTGSTGLSTTSDTDIQYRPMTVTYTAYVNNPSGTPIATSNGVSVTWTSASGGGGGGVTLQLTATPTSLPAGQATTLTAHVTSGWQGNNQMWLKIYDETTGFEQFP